MGIDIQSEACGEGAQHAGHRLDIHTILQRDGCEGVAEVMESNLRDACSFQHPHQHINVEYWGIVEDLAQGAQQEHRPC